MNKHFIGGGKHGRFVTLVSFTAKNGGRIVIEPAFLTREQKEDFFAIPYEAPREAFEIAETILAKGKGVTIRSIDLTDRGDILINVQKSAGSDEDVYAFIVRHSFEFYIYNGVCPTRYVVEYHDLKTRIVELGVNDDSEWAPKSEITVDPQGARVVEIQN